MADQAGDHIPDRLRIVVRSRAREVCECCLLPQWTQDATFHIDHIQPRSARGLTVEANLALACVGCSLRKGAQSVGNDRDTGVQVSLFNPRVDEWTDHFRFTKSWLIKGRTAAGRATIEAVQLNRTSLVRLRRFLARGNQFPTASDDS